jgi:hypothetical protein
MVRNTLAPGEITSFIRNLELFELSLFLSTKQCRYLSSKTTCELLVYPETNTSSFSNPRSSANHHPFIINFMNADTGANTCICNYFLAQ